jgi:hypothetical protein
MGEGGCRFWRKLDLEWNEEDGTKGESYGS